MLFIWKFAWEMYEKVYLLSKFSRWVRLERWVSEVRRIWWVDGSRGKSTQNKMRDNTQNRNRKTMSLKIVTKIQRCKWQSQEHKRWRWLSNAFEQNGWLFVYFMIFITTKQKIPFFISLKWATKTTNDGRFLYVWQWLRLWRWHWNWLYVATGFQKWMHSRMLTWILPI